MDSLASRDVESWGLRVIENETWGEFSFSMQHSSRLMRRRPCKAVHTNTHQTQEVFHTGGYLRPVCHTLASPGTDLVKGSTLRWM